VALAVGQPQRAARLFSATEIIRQAGGYASDGVDQTQVDQNLAATRSALDDAAFDKAWTLGEAMLAEEAIESGIVRRVGRPTHHPPPPPAHKVGQDDPPNGAAALRRRQTRGDFTQIHCDF